MAEVQFPRVIVATETTLKPTANTTTSLAAGEIGFFDVATNLSVNAAGSVDAGGNAKDLFIAQYTGNNLIGTRKTYPIRAKEIKNVYMKAYTAPVNQVSYIGFDGSDTTKGLSFLCETDYSIGIRLESEEINNYFGNAGLFQFVEQTTDCCTNCTAGCTPIDCKVPTSNFVRLINSNQYLNSSSTNGIGAGYISAVMVSDGTFTANNGTGFTMTVTNNSTAVTTSGAHGLSAGAFIRIGGTGNTVAVYKVAAVPTTTTLTLDTPFQGASATTAAANWGPMTATTTCGIQITGGYFNPGTGFPCSVTSLFMRRKPTVFLLSPGQGWDCVTDPSKDGTYNGMFTYTTAAVFGNGSGAEVAELEDEAAGYSTRREYFGYDPRFNKGAVGFAVAATNYDQYYIRYKHNYESGTVIGGQDDLHLVVIAVPTGGAITAAVKTFLNTWIIAEPISLLAIP